MGAACAQCGGQAIMAMAGQPLCLSCADRFNQILQRQNDGLVDQYNYLLDMTEATVGVYGVMPRMRRSQPIIQRGPTMTTFNNINVRDSVVGAINTGEVKRLDVTMDRLRNCGGQSAELAAAISGFTQAILDNNDLEVKDRNDLLEVLSLLTAQASQPEGARMPDGVIKSMWRGFVEFIQKTPSLVGAWEVAKPYLEAALKLLPGGA